MIALNHDRYLNQASWTQSLQDYLFSCLPLDNGIRVLEVGCGTGAILKNLSTRFGTNVFGIDKDFSCLNFASTVESQFNLLGAEVEGLPFASDTFDLVVCHYFLLWLKDPLFALNEIKRILRKNGWLMALAEPDFQSRVDAPTPLIALGQLQNQALARQGCRLDSGRHLPEWFSKSGFSDFKFGISGFEVQIPSSPEWLSSEWAVLSEDLSELCSKEKLAGYRLIDEQAWINGERVLWVPTFYAVGQK